MVLTDARPSGLSEAEPGQNVKATLSARSGRCWFTWPTQIRG